MPRPRQPRRLDAALDVGETTEFVTFTLSGSIEAVKAFAGPPTGTAGL
jgi:hypothetical protein